MNHCQYELNSPISDFLKNEPFVTAIIAFESSIWHFLTMKAVQYLFLILPVLAVASCEIFLAIQSPVPNLSNKNGKV